MNKVVIGISFLISCSGQNTCPFNCFQNISNYEVSPDKITPSGIKIDSGGYFVDLGEIDRRVSAIEDCIINVYNEVKIESGWSCLRDVFEFNRECLTIKIVPPVFSKCSDWEFIGVKAPDELCVAKGLVPTTECPCLWRQIVQDDYTLITSKKIYLWDVGRIITSCNNIWQSAFSKCLMF